MDDRLRWKKLASETALSTPIFRVLREPHTHPEMPEPLPFYVIESLDWVNVIALDVEDPRDPRARMLWVKQFRAGSQSLTLEIPGGGCSREDPTARDSAERELLEESGARAKRWISLGAVNPNPAIFRNRVHSYLALGCVIDPTVTLGDGHEVLEPEWHPFRDRYALTFSGAVDHALVVAALGLLEGHLQDPQWPHPMTERSDP